MAHATTYSFIHAVTGNQNGDHMSKIQTHQRLVQDPERWLCKELLALACIEFWLICLVDCGYHRCYKKTGCFYFCDFHAELAAKGCIQSSVPCPVLSAWHSRCLTCKELLSSACKSGCEVWQACSARDFAESVADTTQVVTESCAADEGEHSQQPTYLHACQEWRSASSKSCNKQLQHAPIYTLLQCLQHWSLGW